MSCTTSCLCGWCCRLLMFRPTLTSNTTNTCMMRTGPSRRLIGCLRCVVGLTCALSSFMTAGIRTSQRDPLKTLKNAITTFVPSSQRYCMLFVCVLHISDVMAKKFVYFSWKRLAVTSIVWVKKIPPRGPDIFLIFFINGWEFVNDFLHTYWTFLSSLDYKFLFNYHRFWRSYAILSTTTQFT